MEGYLEKEKGTLHINICNIPEFEKLAQQAHNEATALLKTINKLKEFELDVKFTLNQ